MVKKLASTYLASTFIVLTLLLTNMTVSADVIDDNDLELQSYCTSIKYEFYSQVDRGKYYFHSENHNGVLYRGWLSRVGTGPYLYAGRLISDPCPYPTPFSKPIVFTEINDLIAN